MTQNKRKVTSSSAYKTNQFPKIFLYIDNIKRFEIIQFFYTILNRVIKPLLPYLFIKRKENLNCFFDVKQNINLLLGFVNKWKISPNSLIREDYFFKTVRSKIASGVPYYQLTSEDSNEFDREYRNNLDRFHLFFEITNELNLKPEERIEEIVKWIDTSPVSRNNKWNGFNTAMRLINWIKLIHMLPEDFQPVSINWDKITSSISVHLKIIIKNIEKHVPGNHVLIQYFSLWLVSNIFKKSYSTKDKAEHFTRKLYKEINKEFYTDGLHFEYSLHYQIQTTLFSLIFLYGLLELDEKLNNEIEEKVKKATVLVGKFLFPDGTIPMIGDNCYTFLNSSLREDIEMCNTLAKIIWKEVNFIKIMDSDLILTKSYAISQLGKSKLIFDVGNIGYKSNPGHGHSDLLSVLYFNEETLFIDPGTRTYDNTPESLAQKKVLVHNTLSVDEEDQAYLWGYFRWSFLPFNLSSEFKYYSDKVLSAQYKVFKKQGSFIHKRKIFFTETGINIRDSVMGSGIHSILINFVLAENIRVKIEGENIVLLGIRNSWHVKIYSENKYEITNSLVNVYPAYNVARVSNKLCIRFKSAMLPFSSEIEVFIIKE